jgi:hypothetical protein
LTNHADGSSISKPKRWSELTAQQQINLACCGDPDDDDTYIDDDDDEDDDLHRDPTPQPEVPRSDYGVYGRYNFPRFKERPARNIEGNDY